VVRIAEGIGVGHASHNLKGSRTSHRSFLRVFIPDSARSNKDSFLTGENRYISEHFLFNFMAYRATLLSGVCKVGDQPPQRSNMKRWSLAGGADAEIKGGVSTYIILKAEAGESSRIYGKPWTFGSSHFSKLVFQNVNGRNTAETQDEGKKSHPFSSRSGNTSRLICGLLLLFLGRAFIDVAFYIADEPQPPMITTLTYWVVWAVAAGFITQGFYLIFSSPETAVRTTIVQ